MVTEKVHSLEVTCENLKINCKNANKLISKGNLFFLHGKNFLKMRVIQDHNFFINLNVYL